MDVIIKGINKGSFCKSNITDAVSLAHFVSLQSMGCVQLKESYLPDGYNKDGKMFIWLPTPDKKSSEQDKYVAAARELINRLVAVGPFTDVYLDVRCNIGGVLSTFIDAILPLIFDSIPENYLQGKDVNGQVITNFYLKKSELLHIISINGEELTSHLTAPENSSAFKDKRFHVLCNRYTMSSGEIICIIFHSLGHKVIGEKTRGLTNGCFSRSMDGAKILVPIYYLGIGNDWYKSGFTP